MFPAMDSRIILVLLVSMLTHSLLSTEVQSKSTTSKTRVMGVVYCDMCSNNTFVRHSYFLPGVKVHLNCKFKATSPTTREEITFSVNRTTDKHGVYRLEIPSVDGISCAEGLSMESYCQASLIGSSSSSCSVPGLQTTTDGITVKSKHANLCIYSLNALNFRPTKRNITLCGYEKEISKDDLNSSKFFFPFFPPFPFPFPFPFPPMPSLPFPPLGPLPPFPSLPFPPLPPFPFPPMPSLPFPPLGPLPPFPSLPFPPFPSLPFPFPNPPSLPFPFPPFPPAPSSAPLAFNFKDPKTWIPSPPRNPQSQNP